MASWLRVTASKTWKDWDPMAAMNLLQGDHTTLYELSLKSAVAMTRSHEPGIP